MTTVVVYYRTGYRHQLAENYELRAGIFPIEPGGNDWVQLSADGHLKISKGYAWDGASGPAINTPSFVRPSLVHDAYCQLWNLGVITDAGRAAADRMLGDMLRADLITIANRSPWPARWFLKSLAVVRPVWVRAAVSWYSGVAKPTPEQILTAP